MAKKTDSKKISKKIKKNEAIDLETNELLEENPLLASPVIPVEEENEMKMELIEEAESLAVLNKQVLEAKRRQVELIVDNEKLDAAKRLIEGINLVADKALDTEVIKRILEKAKTPQDFKFMMEAMQKMSMTLKDVMMPSVEDELGKRKRTKIVAQFQSPSGEKTSIGVEVGGND